MFLFVLIALAAGVGISYASSMDALGNPPLKQYSGNPEGYANDVRPYAQWFGSRAFPNLSATDQVAVTLAWGIAEHGWQFGYPRSNWPGNTELRGQPGELSQTFGADPTGSPVFDTIQHGMAANLATVKETKFAQYANLSDPHAVMSGLGNGTWGTDGATWSEVYQELLPYAGG